MSKMELTPPVNTIRKYSMSSQMECEEFYKENFNFFSYGPSQKSFIMVINIVNDKNIPNDMKNLQLQQIFVQIMNETALNEIEIAVWSVVIDRFVWHDRKKGIRLLLIFAALFTKQKMGDSVEYLIQKNSEKEEFFSEKYQKWVDCIGWFDLSIKEINLRFKYLSESINRKVNYNYYVDDIILRYLPYCHTKRQDLEKIEENELRIEIQEEKELLPNINNISPQDIDISNMYPLPLVSKPTSQNFSTITISDFLCSSPR